MTILNILSRYIPHETLTYYDKDPPWFNSRIKSLLQDKNKIYKDLRRSNTNAQLLNKLNHLQEQLNFLINRSKQYYYARMTKKLTNNVNKNCKAYWSLLRRFLKNRKIPLIPPLFHENKFVADFKEKGELFNSHFATQCSLLRNTVFFIMQHIVLCYATQCSLLCNTVFFIMQHSVLYYATQCSLLCNTVFFIMQQ